MRSLTRLLVSARPSRCLAARRSSRRRRQRQKTFRSFHTRRCRTSSSSRPICISARGSESRPIRTGTSSSITAAAIRGSLNSIRTGPSSRSGASASTASNSPIRCASTARQRLGRGRGDEHGHQVQSRGTRRDGARPQARSLSLEQPQPRTRRIRRRSTGNTASAGRRMSPGIRRAISSCPMATSTRAS